MSDPVPPEDPPQLVARAPDAAVPIPATPVGSIAPAPLGVPALAQPPAIPPEMAALIELIDRGLAPDADDATRGMARELWARCALAIVAAAAMPPTARPPLVVAPAPVAPVPMPAMQALPVPASPIVAAAQTLRGMSADQLLEIALQRLRAALPPGVAPQAPRGIQFQLVPVAPPTGVR